MLTPFTIDRPSSYFLEASSNIRDAHQPSSLLSVKFKWSNNQDLRGVFDDLKGWVTRKSKVEVSTSHLSKLSTIEVTLQDSETVDVVNGGTVPTPSPVVPFPPRRRPKHPPREIASGERSETAWLELWKAAKAGIARHNAILPTRQVALGTSLRKQITIHGSPLRQSHVIKSTTSDRGNLEEVLELNDAESAAAIQEAMFEIVHHFDLPHKHKKNRHRKRNLADQVIRHEFRQNMVGQYSMSAGAPARLRLRAHAV